MDKMIYQNLGYSYTSSYMKDWNTGKKLYIRIIVYYKDKEVYREDIYGPDMYYTTQVFNRACRLNERDNKLTLLGI